MLCAALAVKNGMREQDALATITISAARTAGIEARVGSIAPGKDADVVLLTAIRLTFFAKVRLVTINGQAVYRDF